MPVHQLVSIFVSSVFRDMHVERDLLNRLVIPEVQDALRARGHAITLHGVDLRWGLDTSRVSESERELEILQVCLEEIETAKPFFLCLLGQAYGTEATAEAMAVLAREHGFEAAGSASSITAIEIEFALRLMAQNAIEPVFLLREPDESGPSEDPRVTSQKKHICDRFADRAWRYAIGDLHGDGEVWSAGTAKILIDWIGARLPAPTRDPLDRTAEYREAFEIFDNEVASSFVGRDELLDRMAHDLVAATGGPDRLRILRAGAGEGKTSLAVRLVERLESEGVLTLGHFSGLRPDGASVDAMLRRFCDEICDAFSQKRMTDEVWQKREPADVFAILLENAAAERPVVCVLDTIEEMEPGPPGRLATWWPRKITGQAALLATCRNAASLAEAWSITDDRIEGIPIFTAAEAHQLAVTLCNRRRRQISEAVLSAVLAKVGPDGRRAYANPLWVRLLVEELNLLEGSDFLRVLSFTGSGGDRIERLLLETVESAPGDVLGITTFILDRMEQSFGRDRVGRFASLLAVTRSGLRPSDLGRLWIAGEPPSPLALSQLRHRLRAQIATTGPDSAWRWLHETGRKVAITRYLPDEASKLALHSEIADHLLSLPAFDSLRLSEAPHHLAMAGRAIDLARLAARETQPDTGAAFLELLGPANERGFDLAALIATPELNASDARELAVFLSSVVYRSAERAWPVAPTIAILEQSAEGLERRRALDGPAEEVELDRVLVVVENDLFESLSRVRRHEQATGSVESALARIERIVSARPSSVPAIISLADTLERAGHAAFSSGNFDTALARMERCVETCRRLVLLDQAPRRRMQLASSLAWLGITHKERGELTSALTYLEEALSEQRVGHAVTLAVEPMFAPFNLDNLMLILEYLVDVRAALGDTKGALAAGEELIDERRRAWEKDPGDVPRLRRLAVARMYHGHALAASDPSAAETHFQLATDGLAEVIQKVPDDITALNNFAVSVASLDAARIEQLDLRLALPHGELLQRVLVGATQMSDELVGHLSKVANNYLQIAYRVVDQKLLTATELCVARYVWWTSRLRGEHGEPSREAMLAALPEIGPFKVGIVQMRAALGKGLGSARMPGQPEVLRSVVIAGTGPSLNAGGDLVITPLATQKDLDDALEQARRSAAAGAQHNARRWREAAATLGRRLGSEPISGGSPADGKAQSGDGIADSDAAATASLPPPDKVAAVTQRLDGAYKRLHESLERAEKTEVLDAYQTFVARAVDELGPLLKTEPVAAVQIGICVLVGKAAERQRRPIEALRALEQAVDIARDLEGSDEKTRETRWLGAVAMANNSRLRVAAGRPVVVKNLRQDFDFAQRLVAELPDQPAMLVIAGQLATELAQAVLDEEHDTDAAIQLFQRSLELRKSAGLRLHDPDIALDVTSQLNRLGDLHLETGERGKAEKYFNDALAERRQLLAKAKGDGARELKTLYYIAGSLERLAKLKEQEKDPAAAAALFAEAASIRQQLSEANVPDAATAASSLWWTRSRTADLHLECDRIAEALEWTAAADRAIPDLIRNSPETLDRLSAGLDMYVGRAGMASAMRKPDLWRAWMLRARGTLRALASAGFPLKRFELLSNDLDWSEVLSDPPPPPFPPVFAQIFAHLDAGNIAAARTALVDSGRPTQEGKLVGKLVDTIALTLAGRTEEAKRMLLVDASIPRVDEVSIDARLLLELRARQQRQMQQAGLRIPAERSAPDLRSSAETIYGPDDARVDQLLALAGEELF